MFIDPAHNYYVSKPLHVYFLFNYHTVLLLLCCCFLYLFPFQGDVDPVEFLTVIVTAHYLDPPQSETADLSRLTDALPKWVTMVSWSAVYKEWIF